MRSFLVETITFLREKSGEDFGKYWVSRKIEFFNLFQARKVGNTRFGINFFSELLNMIETEQRIKVINESDKIFNDLAERGKNEIY